MATSFIFNNKQITLPGVYSRITTSETSPARTLDYSKVLVIDSGVYGANWGGGSGIDGENFQGLDSVYTFDTIAEFRSFVKGGMFWKIAEALFTPDYTNPASTGIFTASFCESRKDYIRNTYFLATTSGGTFEVKTLDEGLGANGKLSEAGNLITGYGASIVAGEDDPAKMDHEISMSVLSQDMQKMVILLEKRRKIKQHLHWYCSHRNLTILELCLNGLNPIPILLTCLY